MKVLATTIRQGKETKRIQIGKDKVKLSLFADDMIVYIDPIVSTKKLLALISEFGQTVVYKLNIQKPMTFMYANKEKSERETKGKTPFNIETKI